MSTKDRDRSRAGQPARQQTLAHGILLRKALHAAIASGYLSGRQVSIGRVPGVIIGYNIVRRGRFAGHRYPLLVRTALGVAKCAPAELELR